MRKPQRTNGLRAQRGSDRQEPDGGDVHEDQPEQNEAYQLSEPIPEVEAQEIPHPLLACDDGHVHQRAAASAPAPAGTESTTALSTDLRRISHAGACTRHCSVRQTRKSLMEAQVRPRSISAFGGGNGIRPASPDFATAPLFSSSTHARPARRSASQIRNSSSVKSCSPSGCSASFMSLCRCRRRVVTCQGPRTAALTHPREPASNCQRVPLVARSGSAARAACYRRPRTDGRTAELLLATL